MKLNEKKLAQTEVVDPICLAAKTVESCDSCCCCGEMDVNSVPDDVCKVFDDIIVDCDNCKKVYVTIGLFTIVRLTRSVELVIPVIDFCIPENGCVQSVDNNPCELFERLNFPVDEFFPPEKCHFDSLSPTNDDCCCC